MEYERTRRIHAPIDDVFLIVSQIENLPGYVPTVQEAELVEEGHVRLRGQGRGSPYQTDGWLRIDSDRRRLEWGVDERAYAGSMVLTEDGDATEVVVRISLPPWVGDSGEPITGEREMAPDPVEDELEAAMDSLRNMIEGRGGKVQA